MGARLKRKRVEKLREKGVEEGGYRFIYGERKERMGEEKERKG